jgi:glycosyltransferase involved in cell wall biosynthesis
MILVQYMFFISIIYWLCVGALVTTYVVYPLVLKLLHRFFKPNTFVYTTEEKLPHISILMAAHNEEKVIAEKINSVLAASLPNLTFWIGSDNSKDKTNQIVENLAAQNSQIRFFPFQERQGKPSIINALSAKAEEAYGGHIFIITDANVIFTENTIFELIKHFKNDKIAIVESNIVGIGLKDKGISKTETSYVSGEILNKYYESLIFKVFSGPMGGCFAIRSSYFTPVPSHFMVDDFYITMAAFEKGGEGVVEPKALCFEGVSHHISEEIRRKIRIGTGNFQNLFRFKWLWLKFPLTPISIVFLLHKVLRWCGPILILLSFIALLFLVKTSFIYVLLLIFQISIAFIIPLCYFILEKNNVHIAIFRLVTYFFAANYAVFRGMINYFKRKNNGIWEPTKR